VQRYKKIVNYQKIAVICQFFCIFAKHPKHQIMRLQNYLSLICILFLFASCERNLTCENTLTEAEKQLINGADANTPFQVLLTANKEDSLLLRKQSKDIKPITNNPDLQLLIERLRVTLEAEEGVGIASPQIGIARNVFLMMRFDKPERPVEVVINPKITAHSDETIYFESDGCLSILDISGNSRRYKWIEVEYYNEHGEKINERLEGYSRFCDFTGIIFQHEYDHLRGRLFIDRLCQKNITKQTKTKKLVAQLKT